MKTKLTILTFLLLTSFSDHLFACNCLGYKTVQEEVKHSDAIIVGTILNKQIITVADSTMFGMFPHDSIMRISSLIDLTIARYDLLVQDVYKGKVTRDTLTIYTGLGGRDCGIRFDIGKKYIVYGEIETYLGQVYSDFKFPQAENTFWTYNCLRTTSFFQEEITEIEKYAKKRKRKSGKK